MIIFVRGSTAKNTETPLLVRSYLHSYHLHCRHPGLRLRFFHRLSHKIHLHNHHLPRNFRFRQQLIQFRLSLNYGPGKEVLKSMDNQYDVLVVVYCRITLSGPSSVLWE